MQWIAWHLLRIKGKGLVVCNNSILPDCLAYYCACHDDTTDRREGRKRGAEELMTALTKWQKEAKWRLQAKYDGEPKPINSFASTGGGQVYIDIVMECTSQLDIKKFNNAAMA